MGDVEWHELIRTVFEKDPEPMNNTVEEHRALLTMLVVSMGMPAPTFEPFATPAARRAAYQRARAITRTAIVLLSAPGARPLPEDLLTKITDLAANVAAAKRGAQP